MGKQSREKRNRAKRVTPPHPRESEPGRSEGRRGAFDLRQRWHVLVAVGSAITIALVVVGVGLSSLLPSQRSKVLPPITAVGHIESYPEERISEEPIPLPVQRHILEHVPLSTGEQRRGVLLQYNCEKFECEPDLVDRLAAIAEEYEYVYMAPYPAMDAKIALTTYGRILTLDAFDEGKIVAFVEGP